MSTIETQLAGIRAALKAGQQLTPMDVLHQFGCWRLGARIYDLREEGMNIHTEMFHDEASGKRYARYTLINTPIERTH